jgi:predicted transcriptional regulator
MTHEIYHLLSKNSDQYFSSIEDVKDYLKAHSQNAKGDLKIYKMIAEEGEDDEIFVSEYQLKAKDLK